MYFTIRCSPSNHQWYWQLRSENNNIIANGEGYVRKASCLHTIALVDGGRNFPIYEI